MSDKENKIASFRQNKWKFFLKKNRFAILIFLGIILVSCLFISKKQGYHMDELLSFELANAEFTPWIVTTQPEGRLEKFVKNEIYGDSFGETCSNIIENVKDVLKNRGESKMLSYKADVYEEPVWITAKQFQDYITTDSRDNFNYLSVYFNVKDDNHPPLHFMALHTMSSIWKGQISPWMGCSINLVMILGICVLLLKISREFLNKTEEFAGAVCLLYALSMAGIATLLLIRMYAMLTFFCVAELYLHLKKKQSGQWEKGNKLLILVTVCGFLTQYYFVIFMLFLAGVTVTWLWKTEKKQVLYYARTMGISALFGLCIFPFSIADVLYSERGVESVQNLGSGFSGIGERLLQFGMILKEEVLGGWTGLGILLLLTIAASLYWLFRKFGAGGGLAKVEKKKREREGSPLEDFRWEYRMIWIPCLGYFLVVAKIAPYYADRYLMPVFPLMALFIAVLLQSCLDLLKKRLGAFGRKGVLTVFAVLLVVPNLFTVKPAYLYQGYDLQEEQAETYSDRVCLCVYDGVGYYENLPEFTHYRETLMVKEEELFHRSRDQVLAEETEIVVLMKVNTDYLAVADYLEEEYGFEPGPYLIRGLTVHGDTIQFFQKK